jgi:phosphopantothenoylcysteine decarboxylase
LRKWADSLLIAPLDANTLAKVANGFCDNLVSSLIRAWDQKKPLYFAPAMNTAMWDNPLTYQHLKVLKELLLYRVGLPTCLFVHFLIPFFHRKSHRLRRS